MLCAEIGSVRQCLSDAKDGQTDKNGKTIIIQIRAARAPARTPGFMTMVTVSPKRKRCAGNTFGRIAAILSGDKAM
jgi:hypothetical protein